MKVFSVSELTSAIKSLIEPQFRGICVKGEVSNFKRQSSGHLYFNLKDVQAQISAAFFRGYASSLSRLPKDGDQVMVTGEIGLYAPRGQYQIIVRELEFLGVGELLLKLHQLKEKLERQGWFDPSCKKTLPKFPKKIGVITSPTGAVIQDIIHVLTKRFSSFQILLNPVKVQGEGAAEEIAKAIEEMNRYQLADVLIVGRGGGSIEDLWAFNEEIVAKAIFESKIPIISAVGHETDFTIADMTADVRAPTPSAAAAIAMQEKENLLQFLKAIQKQCRQIIGSKIYQSRTALLALQKHPLLSSPYGVLAPTIQKLDDLSRKFEMVHPKKKIQQAKEKLKRLEDHMRSLHPKNVLKKGYSILFSEKDHSIILSIKDLEPNQSFTALLQDGKIGATTNEVKSASRPTFF